MSEAAASAARQFTGSPTMPGLAFLAGGGELGVLIRAHDWSASPLGPPEDWPPALKLAVRIMLTSRQPFWIGWGPELIYFYNDAYKSIIGGKHPWALGRPTAEVWRELWSEIGPMLETAMGGDMGTYVESQFLIMERNGYPEETYYTFSYSPIANEDGTVGGIICANSDETKRVIGERQLALLKELAAQTADARSLEEACAKSKTALLTDARDLPFAMLYLADPEKGALALACAAGIDENHPACPPELRPGSPFWPRAAGSHEIEIHEVGPEWRDTLPTGPWKRPITHIALMPIAPAGDSGKSGFLVAGLNPCRLPDEDYRSFLGLVGGQIASAIANAQAYADERLRAERLSELDRAKTAFFSNVSHEFRTPLTLMLGPLEELIAASHGPQKAQLAVVHRNGLRLLKLVNTLLDFARAEAGRTRAVFRPVDFAAQIADLASSFRAAFEKAGIAFEVSHEILDQPVYVDQAMLEKIVNNLLSNAFKYTLDGAVSVHVRQHDGTDMELSVSDTGVGIPERDLPRIFEKFHRVEGAGGRSIEGSGIGLALVKELVGLHGGHIDVESRLGQGTIFRVYFPLGTRHIPADQIEIAPAAAERHRVTPVFLEEDIAWLPEDETPDTAADESERVLVADDNDDMRRYIAGLLRQDGFAVELVADGEAALEAIRRKRPALLLSDVMMPRKNGFELLAALRGDDTLKNLPVILLSARAGNEAAVEGLEAGADDYLTKPFASRELLARVRANLNLARLRREALRGLEATTAQLRAVLDTAPAAIWFTNDSEAKRIESNRYAAEYMRVPEGANVSLSADAPGRPDHFILRDDGVALPPDELPVQRAARGEKVERHEYEVRFGDGSSAHFMASAAPIYDRKNNITGAVAVGVDVTERRKAERQRMLLINELNHRVKNTLATIQSMAMQSFPKDKAATADFMARLSSLSAAHDILTTHNWSGADVGRVVENALSPFRIAQIRIDGEPLHLSPKHTLALSMALHELATNAVKYGALSREGGEVTIAWTVATRRDGRMLELTWTESGGPAVVPPTKRGFGSRLLSKALASDFGSAADMDFAPEGLRVTLHIRLFDED